MPQGEGTYGSQVGRPSKKRTSFVNDNGWTNELLFGSESRQRYISQAKLSNAGGSSKYGQPSVMEKHRKPPMTDVERDFRKEGGIEALALKARGIDQNTHRSRNLEQYSDQNYQVAATDFRGTLDKPTQKNIDRDVGREVINQRKAQMHMGSPSNYKARQDRKMFGSTMLTMPNTVRRKQ
tara:strand:+ start:367 stop:906 length:540 start_codon:yes stop_codon:yes gene_type:complete